MSNPGLIVVMSKEERIAKAIKLRKAGKSLDDIADAVGYSRMWVCKLMKKAGIPVNKVTFDKRGSPRTKHGMRFHPTYYSWYSMKTRCGNPNHNDFKHWGGRGITYDPRWECFLTFLDDMGARPGKEYSLDRIDNDKGYYKENCRWLLRSHQGRNSRVTKLDEWDVTAIRTRYARGSETYKGMRGDYGVSPSHIAQIVKRTTWSDL